MYDTATIQEALETCKAGLNHLETINGSDPVRHTSLKFELLSLISPIVQSTVGDHHQMNSEQYQELHSVTSQLRSA